MRQIKPVMVLILSALAYLLIVHLSRLWFIGITNHDDAVWALQAHNGSDPIGDVAQKQGRIWCYVACQPTLYVLANEGSYYAEILKSGGFLVFFFAFFFLIGAIFGRAIGYLSAILCAGLLVFRWETTNAYPLLVYPTLALFAGSVAAAICYLRSGRKLWIPLSFVAYFISLFSQEGITALHIGLYALLVASYVALHVGPRPSRAIALLAIWMTSTLGYLVLYYVWFKSHPTSYDGHEAAAFNINNILTVAMSFATSGSILYEFVASYDVRFVDSVAGVQRVAHYSPWLSAVNPTLVSAVAGGLALTASFAVLRTRMIETARPYLASLLAAIAGAAIAAIPMLLVAASKKYQSWFFDQGVQSYYLTTVSHFGVAVSLAAAIIALSKSLKSVPVNALFAVAVAIFIGALTATAIRRNGYAVQDMRPEAARWHVLKETVELARQNGFEDATLWAPQFASGSWYAVLDSQYWTEYATAVLGSPIEFVVSEQGKALNRKIVNLSYTLDGRRLHIRVSHSYAGVNPTGEMP